jgi:hypothetical protein
VRVDEDAYARFPFSAEEPVDVRYEVRVVEGPPVDVLLVPGSDSLLDRAVPYDEAASTLVTRAVVHEARLAAGDWQFVVDNSVRGRARPPGDFRNSTATVDVAYRVE